MPLTAGAEQRVIRFQNSGGKFIDMTREFGVVKTVGQNDTKKLNDTGQKQIGLCGGSVACFSALQSQHRLERVDGTLHSYTFCVECHPFGHVTDNPKIKTLVGIGIDVDTTAIGRCGARIFAATTP